MAGRIDHHDRSTPAIGNKDPFAIGMRRNAIWILPGGDFGDYPLAGDINRVDLAGHLTGDIGAAAIGQKSDATRPFTNSNVAGLLMRLEINHINLFSLFRTDVNPPPIRAEHGMLGVAPIHLNSGEHLATGSLNQHHAVIVLNRCRQQLAIGRQTKALRRISQARAAQHLAALGVERQQAAFLGIGQINQLAVSHRATRPLADRNIGLTLVSCGINDAERGRFFIRHVSERGSQQRAGE